MPPGIHGEKSEPDGLPDYYAIDPRFVGDVVEKS
jgi:hypothetical protein